jgi:hypothetical protein
MLSHISLTADVGAEFFAIPVPYRTLAVTVTLGLDFDVTSFD